MSNVSKETFYTLEKEAQSLYEIKRSRFIGYAMPVETVKEAQDFSSRINFTIITLTTKTDKPSDMGKLHHTPSVPK